MTRRDRVRLQLHPRPSGAVAEEIVGLAELLVGRWFTPNVPADTRRDLLFQDALCLYEDGALRSFLVFTSWDGSLHITLMGTHPDHRGRGLGSRLLDRFLEHAAALGFPRVVALTVPPEAKPAYAETVAFYKKHGFVEGRRYRDLWEHGAIELVRQL